MASVARAPTSKLQLRWIGAYLLVVLGVFALVGSVIVIWAHALFLDTDRWVGLVGPLSANPAVQEVLATYLAEQIVAATGLPAAGAGGLPGVGGVLGSAARGVVQGAISNGLATDAFQSGWLALNRGAHEGLAAAVRGEPTTALAIRGDALVVDLAPLVARGLGWVGTQVPGGGALVDLGAAGSDTGLSPTTARQFVSRALRREVPPDFGQVVVLRSGLLAGAQGLVRGLDVLVFAGPLVALVLLAGAVGLAPARARLVAIGGAVLVACCLMARLAIALWETTFVEAYRQPTARLAAAAFADALVADLVAWIVVLLLVGLSLLLVGAILNARQRQSA
jgi:hypothetical protein